MTLPRPTASLLLEGSGAPSLAGIGGSGALTAAQAGVRRVVVDLSVDEAHDRAELTVWHGSALAGAEPGAKLTVGLGHGDTSEDVLTVEVCGSDRTGWGGLVTGYAASRRLASTYVGRAYLDQSVGDVVSDLLAEGDVESGDVDCRLRLPVLHSDPRRSVWRQLHALARRTGSQVTTGADGRVSFTPIPGAAGGGLLGAVASSAAALGLTETGELREGADLIAFRSGTRLPGAAVAALSPVGSKAGLLLAEPDDGSAPPAYVDPMMRSREAAEGATAAAQAAARRHSRTAVLSCPGRADLRAGGTLKARGEDHRVLRVRHVLDAESGYRCELLLEADR